MRKILIFVLMYACLVATAQKQKRVLLESTEEVREWACLELDEAMKGPEGELFRFAEKNGIKGNYTFDITTREKGDVASVFAVGNEGGTIEYQNMIRSYLINNIKFMTFKMPKGKRYKFQYEFKFQ